MAVEQKKTGLRGTQVHADVPTRRIHDDGVVANMYVWRTCSRAERHTFFVSSFRPHGCKATMLSWMVSTDQVLDSSPFGYLCPQALEATILASHAVIDPWRLPRSRFFSNMCASWIVRVWRSIAERDHGSCVDRRTPSKHTCFSLIEHMRGRLSCFDPLSAFGWFRDSGLLAGWALEVRG